MQEEIWKDIPGFEGRYQVSSFGRIKSLPRKVKAGRTYRYVKEHILSYRYDYRGYARVCIKIHPKKYWFSVHRLIAEIFIPNPNNYPYVEICRLGISLISYFEFYLKCYLELRKT